MTDKIMRQFSRIALTAGAAMALTATPGCSSEIFDGPGHGANTLITATSQAPADASGTRTAVDPTKYEDGSMGLNWVDSDKIGVFGDKETKNAEFTKAGSGEVANATFGGNLAVGEQPKYAYFPYTATAGTDPANVQGTLKPTQTYNSRTRRLESEDDWKVATGFTAGADGGQYRMSFRHLFAFFRFDVSAPEGCELQGQKLQSITLKMEGKQLAGPFTLDLTAPAPAAEFTETAGQDQLEMTWSDTPTLTAGEFYGYLSCAPQTGMKGQTIKIEVTTDHKIASFKATCAAETIEPDSYYTLNFNLKEYQDNPTESGWSVIDNPNRPSEDNAAWVSGLNSHLACANTVFAITGQPFMHKIRVPQSSSQTEHAVVPVKTGVQRVWNLPDGLTWNADRCLVQGTAPAAGNYIYSVEFTVDGTTYQEGIKLHVAASESELHQARPHMGWQSWNVLETNIDEASIKAVADALVSNGWADAGYKWLGIDDCWQKTDGSRNSDGSPVVNPTKFPNGLKTVTDYIHSKGLKAGIYSDCGTVTCASGTDILLGAYGYESQTAKAFTDWGFDKLKEDWFWKGHGDDDGKLDFTDTNLAHQLYGKMGSGIQAAGNKIMLSMCEWGIHEPWKWGPEAGGSSWRMSYDHRDGWMGQNGKDWLGRAKANDPTANTGGIGLKNTIDLMRYLWPYVGINRYNDADMLVVGIRGGGTSSNDLLYSSKGSMGDAEYETEFAMWCMYSSPLLLTLDVRKTNINSHDVTLLKNEELIAINQDALGQGAEYIKTVNGCDYYMKDLANGDVAIAVVNLSDSQQSYTITLSDYEALSAGTTYKVRDLLAKSDVAGTLSSSSPITGTLAAHGTYIIRLSRQN